MRRGCLISAFVLLWRSPISAFVLFLLSGSSAFAQGPTPTPTSMSLDHIGFVESQVMPIVAASLAVGMFWIFTILASAGRRSNALIAFLVIEIFVFPVWIVNVAWWAGLHVIWFFFYWLVDSFQRIAK